MIYLDIDGVVADFDRHYYCNFGVWPTRWPLPDNVDWKKIASVPDFFLSMPITPGGFKLVDYVSKLGEPYAFLTGVPSSIDAADNQKVQWAREKWPTIKVNCCPAKDKYKFCKPGDTLIDDYTRYRDEWEGAGGIFIHYIDTPSTIQKLWSLRR